MKTTLGVILGVVLGIVIVAGVSAFLLASGFFSFDQNPATANTQNTPRVTTTAPTTTPSSATTSSLKTTSPVKPAVTQTPTRTTVSSTATVTVKPEVKFTINVSNFNISGNTGDITTQVTNAGNADAHNSWAKVEIYCQGALIKIGGQDYYRRDLGTIQAGATITSQDTLKVSLGDALKVMQNGATCKLTIISDEATMGYEYQF